MPITSMIDSITKIEGDQAAVSLVVYRNHASIVLEYIENMKYKAVLSGFFPESPVAINPASIFFDNRLVNGRIDIVPLDSCNHASLREAIIKYLVRDHSSNSNGLLTIRTFAITKDKAMGLFSLINHEKKQPPQFQVSGNRKLNAKGHNCITWAIEKLQRIDIRIESNQYSSKVEDTFVVTNPNHNNGMKI